MKELEMILQALTTLGEAGKEAFIWWLIMEKGLSFLGWIALVVAFYSGVVKVTKTVLLTSKVTSLRDSMGIGSPGYILPSEIREMERWIADRKNK